MVTEATNRVLAIIVSFGGAAPLEAAIKRMSDLLLNFCGASDVETMVAS
jgi:DNA/RNA-binding domain of Phe-tRNA-synthetase-like protein